MTKNRSSRRNNKRKSSPCDSPKALDQQPLNFNLSTGTAVEVRASEKLQATRLCGETDIGDFTLCDLIYDGGSSRVCLPSELWENELIEPVAHSVLHLLYGAREVSEIDEIEVLHQTPWLNSGRHAVIVGDHGGGALIVDLSNGGDHEDHTPALELQEDVPVKKCRLPRFAVHQTMATLTVVFFVQNVDKDSLAVSFCTCNSLLRLEFSMSSEHHTTYRIVLGHPSIEGSLLFPQKIRFDVIRDTLVVYLEKAEDQHNLWTDIVVGAGGTSELRTFSLVDETVDKGCDSCMPVGIEDLQRRYSAPCESLFSNDGCRGILKNRRLCSRTLSECSESMEFSSWDLSESLRTSSMQLDDAKKVTFNEKVLETKYKPGGISIKRRSQRTRSLSDSSEDNSDSICDDLQEKLSLGSRQNSTKEELFHFEMDESRE